MKGNVGVRVSSHRKTRRYETGNDLEQNIDPRCMLSQFPLFFSFSSLLSLM